MKKKVLSILIPVLLIALIVSVALVSKSKASYTDAGDSITDSDYYFDTVISVTLYDTTDDTIISDCFDLCEEYENLLSRTVEGSDIWNVNHAKGKSCEVDKRTYDLLSEGLRYCKLTGGRFDLSIAAVSTLWDFDDHDNELPSEKEIKAALPHIDYKKIVLNENGNSYSVTLQDPEMMIDLGGIAKGYIADRIRDLLADEGIERAIINLGGNVLVIGDKGGGDPFVIGIQYPFKEEGTIIAAAGISDTSLVSSGGYERYIEKDGKIYHHILDPKTGYAVDSDVVSVSICCPSSVKADALSTSVFLLGSKKGAELIESLDGVSALIITDDGEFHNVGKFPIKEDVQS